MGAHPDGDAGRRSSVSPSGARLLHRRRPEHRPGHGGHGGRDREPLRPAHLPGFLGRRGGRCRRSRRAAGSRTDRRRPARPSRGPRLRRSRHRGPVDCVPTGSRSTGLTDPVGVDPDDCCVRLDAAGVRARGGARRLPHRRAPDRPARTGHGLGQRPGGLGPAGLRRLRRPGPRPPTRPTSWTVQVAGRRRQWGRSPRRRRFTTALRRGDWTGPLARARQAGSQQPDRVTYLRTEVTPPAGHRRRGPRPTSPPPTPTASSSTGRRWTPGRASRYPDEQYVRAVDLTGHAAARQARAPSACCTVGTGPARAGPPRRPGLLLQLRSGYADGRHVVLGSDGSWQRAPGRVAALTAAQRRRRRLRGMGGRARPPPGMVEPGLRRQLVDARHRRRAGRHRTVHRDVRPADHHPRRHPSFRSRLHTLASGAVVADFGAVYAARPRVRFAQGEPRTDRDAAGGLPARSRRRRSRPCTGRRRPTSRPRTSCARAARPSRPSPTSGSATCRSTTPASRSRGRHCGA